MNGGDCWHHDPGGGRATTYITKNPAGEFDPQGLRRPAERKTHTARETVLKPRDMGSKGELGKGDRSCWACAFREKEAGAS